MKETDIIDPVRIGKFSLGYFRWSVTAHIFQPKRFWKYCTKQVYEWKRGLSLQFISLTGIYTLLMFIFHTDGQPFITSSGTQMLIWFGFFIYIAKSSSSLADQIGIRSKRVVYLTVPVSTAEKYIAHLLSTIVLYPLLFFAAIVVAQYASELISSTIRGEMFNPGTPLQDCFSMWKNSGFTTIFFVTSVLSTIATFTLGATLWQKNSFLKTVSALFLFSIVFSFSCSLFLTNEEIGSAVSYLFIGKFFDNSSNFFWLINTVQIAETIILGYIGYLRMKELEINETKR